jgi:sigma-B regulation protein RsbU (phosphoserine phosphatase)
MVQGMLHAQITMLSSVGDGSLVDIVQSANGFVCTRAPVEKYVTLAILRYTFPASAAEPAQVELINGGHVCPIVVRAGGKVETIGEGDPPVGLLDFARFHTISFSVGPGDRLVLLSDGFTEAEDPEGNQFGDDELEKQLGTQKEPVTELCTALAGFCKGASARDDQTILTIERLA